MPEGPATGAETARGGRGSAKTRPGRAVAAPAPRFFATPAALRRWFARHHRTASELWVGYRKKATGKASVTWQESVDEALCVGWIDGIRKRIDEESYTIRFTPRRKGSVWSEINARRMEELLREGRVLPAGQAAFAARSPEKTAIYPYEQRHGVELDAELSARFRAHPAAWQHFWAQPPGYRQTLTWWVMSAKRPQTRERRLATLIAASAAGKPLRELVRIDAAAKPSGGAA